MNNKPQQNEAYKIMNYEPYGSDVQIGKITSNGRRRSSPRTQRRRRRQEKAVQDRQCRTV